MPPSSSTPRIAVIGAGPSGITAAKNALQAGLGEHLVVFEKGGQVGGNWIYNEDAKHSSVYESTHIISSRYLSEYEDFPFAPEVPDYPHHATLCQYFQNYANHFGVTEKIQFHTEVLHVQKDSAGKWLLEIRCADGVVREELFDILMVANGHHWDPRMPEFANNSNFDGTVIHSHAFKNNRPFRNRRVLVVGGGNSACDVAVECSRVATTVCLSTRRGHWFVPKFMLGIPIDCIIAALEFLPTFVRQVIFQFVIYLFAGSHKRLGLPTPDYGILEGHVTLNSELFYFIGHGEIAPRPGIDRLLTGNTVLFTDGRREEFDTIICGTGYKISFPFFDESFIDWKDATYVPLWRRMFHHEEQNLYFIGLFQPLGCIWPLADYQAMLACQEIVGNYQRPKDLKSAIEKERRAPHYRFIEAPRHSTEVDYHRFRDELLKELKTCGRKPHRAKAASKLVDRMAGV